MSSETSAGAAQQTEEIAGKEYKKLGYSLYVWISPDKLECRCSYVPRQQGSMMTSEEFSGYLAQSAVKEGVDQGAVVDFTVKAAAGQTLKMVLIASGVPAQNGRDGYLDYIANPSASVKSEVDDSSTIDLHNVITFINVEPGDSIATMMPPEEGRSGLAVTGQIIPAKPGNPLKLKIGNNIKMADDGVLLVSEAAGRVCAAGGEICVAEEFIVSGDVNFRVGAIDFKGFVEVRGDILDGFNVHAAKGLRVNGNIGACNITSEGDISFCGMDGQEKGTIVCGGSIVANFIHDTHVECGGDVNIDVELHNSHVNSLGKIIVNKGAISGGSCVALGGIETNRVGSHASVKTHLRAGIDYRDMVEFEHLVAELEKNSVQMKQASSFQDLEALRKTRGKLSEALVALRTKADGAANTKINIKSMLYDNTYLCVGMVVRERVDEKSGPFSVIENSLEGGLRFLSMTGLDVKAADIEKAVVREESLHRQ